MMKIVQFWSRREFHTLLSKRSIISRKWKLFNLLWKRGGLDEDSKIRRKDSFIHRHDNFIYDYFYGQFDQFGPARHGQ